MKKMYGGSVDRYMCTGLCPCDIAHKDKYKAATEKGFEFTIDPKQYRVPEYSDAYLNADQK